VIEDIYATYDGDSRIEVAKSRKQQLGYGSKVNSFASSKNEI
jgi:hypothetical protein